MRRYRDRRGLGAGLGFGATRGDILPLGNNGAFKAFTIGSMRSREALVFFMNGASGLSLMPEIVAALMPGTRPSLAWLDYGRHDAPARRMLREARAHGLAAIWKEMEGTGLSADDQQWIARGLIAAGRDKDGRWLRKRIKQGSGDGSPPTR